MKRIVGALLISCMSSGVWADGQPHIVYTQSTSRCVLCNKLLGPIDYLGNRPDTRICLACFEKERPPKPGSGSSSPRPESASPSGSSLSIESVYSGDAPLSSPVHEDFKNPFLQALVEQTHYVDDAYEEFAEQEDRERLEERVSTLEKERKKKFRKRRNAGIADTGQIRAGRRNALVPGSGSYREARLFGVSSPGSTTAPTSPNPLSWNYKISVRDSGKYVLGVTKGLMVEETEWESPIKEVWSNGSKSVVVTENGYFFRDSMSGEDRQFSNEEKAKLLKFLKERDYLFNFRVQVFADSLPAFFESVPSQEGMSLIDVGLEEEGKIAESTWEYQVLRTSQGSYVLEGKNKHVGAHREYALDAPIDEVWYNADAQLLAHTVHGYSYYNLETNEQRYFPPYKKDDLDKFLKDKKIKLTLTVRFAAPKQAGSVPSFSYSMDALGRTLFAQDEQGKKINCKIGSKILKVFTRGTEALVQAADGLYLYNFSKWGSDNIVDRKEFPDTLGAYALAGYLGQGFVPCAPGQESLEELLDAHFAAPEPGQYIMHTTERPLSYVLQRIQPGIFGDSETASDDEYRCFFNSLAGMVYIVGPDGEMERKVVDFTKSVYRRGAQILTQNLKDLVLYDLKNNYTERFIIGSQKDQMNLNDMDLPDRPARGFKAEVLTRGFKRVQPEEGKTSTAIVRAAEELSEARKTAAAQALAEKFEQLNIV